MRDVPPPESVTRPPPSRTASLVNTIGDETVIVTGEEPQANTIVPPAAAAERSEDAVQLAGVPSPTTAAGADTSARRAGASQVGVGTGGARLPDEELHAASSAAATARLAAGGGCPALMPPRRPSSPRRPAAPGSPSSPRTGPPRGRARRSTCPGTRAAPRCRAPPARAPRSPGRGGSA